MMVRSAWLAALAASGLSGVAHADAARTSAPPSVAAASPKAGDPEPAPAALQAGDANLESIADRSGLTFSAAAGGGLMVGFGIQDSVGRGGSVSLRLGQVATPRTVITFELGITAALHKPALTGDIATNSDTNLLAGAQYYVNPSFWLRLGGGIGVYQGQQVTLSSGKAGDLMLAGPAVLFGLGVDVARFKWAVLGIELSTSAMANSDGVLVTTGADVGLAFD